MKNILYKAEYIFINIMSALSFLLWAILPIATSIAMSVENNSWYYLFGLLGLFFTVPIGLGMASMWQWCFDE